MTDRATARFGLPRPSFSWPTRRAFFKVPVIGWIARDLIEGDADNVWYLLVAIVSLWVIAVATWGLPALYLPAVIVAPLVMVLLVLITRG